MSREYNVQLVVWDRAVGHAGERSVTVRGHGNTRRSARRSAIGWWMRRHPDDEIRAIRETFVPMGERETA